MIFCGSKCGSSPAVARAIAIELFASKELTAKKYWNTALN